MAVLRWRGFRNPATWYLGCGFALLAGSTWLPYATAERTTRVEGRADAIASALLEAVGDPVEALDAADVATVLARMFYVTERTSVYVADLEVVEPPPPDTLLVLRNKHYLFHLAVSPHDPRDEPGPKTMPAYEVMAWPRREFGPAHSVFFYADNAIPAYTRNLGQGYAGLGDDRPWPGCARRRQVLYSWTTSFYGADDRRWIAHR